MPLLSSTSKAHIRQRLKAARNQWRGYGSHYANTQCSGCPYAYLWSQATTPIKQRSNLLSGHENMNDNRLQNMQLTAERIDGLILHPQEIFSFWQRVPQPTIANGFRAGPMLVRGRLTTDVGGGLCQISSTLFNALLWANLQVLERHNHSIDSYGSDRFFTLGQDATVAYGYKDLIVRNTSEAMLQLRLQIAPESAQVTASIWGNQPMPVTVQVTSQILQELPPAPSGIPEGMSGWLVKTVRVVQPVMGQSIAQSAPDQINYCVHDTYHPYVPIQ
jgi:vancomycin resistance protein VanW